MKYMCAVLLFLSGCVSSETATAYAQRAHPECSKFQVLNHNRGGEGSLTEVSMECAGIRRSITVKCRWGGFLNDTTCYENN